MGAKRKFIELFLFLMGLQLLKGVCSSFIARHIGWRVRRRFTISFFLNHKTLPFVHRLKDSFLQYKI